MERVGEARLAQDAQIQSRFLAGWNTTLNTNLMFATKARRNVEKARLTLDAVKAKARGTTWKLGGAGSPRAETHDQAQLSQEQQEEIEKAEDEFVTQTEEAVGVMKNVSANTNELMRSANATSHLITLRSWIHPSRCATSQSLLLLKWSTTRRPMRSSASLHRSLTACRSSRRQVTPRRIPCRKSSHADSCSCRRATERAARGRRKGCEKKGMTLATGAYQVERA
jgi:hypothetical protein